jgi:hypothetical protein
VNDANDEESTSNSRQPNDESDDTFCGEISGSQLFKMRV